MNIKPIITLCLIALMTSACGVKETATMPLIKGETFADDEGNHINAHGGMIMEKDGTYYWYGENRPDSTPGNRQLGVACYTSTDLRNWKNRGIVLPTNETEGDLLEKGCIVERPKVVFCPATGKYVMWFHHELKGLGYGAAHAAVATADNPLGPFELIRSARVNQGVAPMNIDPDNLELDWPDLDWWTPDWRNAVEMGMMTGRDLEDVQMSRDMTIFVDDDGKAYHVYSSEENLTLHIAELDSTYTNHTGRYVRLFPGGHNEAPAMFKHDGTYWMITSGCTGWAPNEARLMRADSIFGPWEQLPNPCRGEKSELTYLGQSTYVMNLDGNYTFMADIWNPKNLADSRHLWLPVRFDENGTPFIESPYDTNKQ